MALQCQAQHFTSLRTLVLCYLSFLFFSKVIHDIEDLVNLLRSFPLDHIGNSLARNVMQTIDVW